MARTFGAVDKKPRKNSPKAKKKVMPRVKRDAEYVYRWIRAEYFTDPKRIELRKRHGWEAVTAEQQPNFKEHVNSNNQIEAGGLILCRYKKIDWASLCTRLQQALNDQIAENQECEKLINNLTFELANARHKEIGYQAVISYMESKRGNTTV